MYVGLSKEHEALRDELRAYYDELLTPEVEEDLRRGEGVGQVSAVAPQDVALLPGALVDELLQGLFGVSEVREFGGPGDSGGDRFDALAFAILEQAAEVDAAPGELRGVAVEVLELLGVVAQPLEGFGGEFWGVSLVHSGHTNKAPGRFVES